MKNIFKVMLSVLPLFILASCEEDTVMFDSVNGQSITSFRVDNQRLTVGQDAGENVGYVTVDVSTVSNQDRTVVFELDAESTASGAQYTIDQATAVVPAGAYNAEIKVTANYDALEDCVPVTLIFHLVDVGGARIDSKPTNTLTIQREFIAPESLAGTHSFSQTEMSVGDGEGGINQAISGTITGTVVFTEVDGPLSAKYKISDLSFGLYPQVYGESPATNGSAGFDWNCKSFIPYGQDQFGDDGYAYTIVSVQGAELVLTWINDYGDRGKVTLIRQGEQDWPDVMQD